MGMRQRLSGLLARLDLSPSDMRRPLIALALTWEVAVVVALNPRDHKRVEGDHPARVLAAAIVLAIVILALWAIVRALVRRARPSHPADPLAGFRAWAVAFLISAALSVRSGLRAHGFAAHHLGLLVGVEVFGWAVVAFALRVLFALAGSVRERIRAKTPSPRAGCA